MHEAVTMTEAAKRLGISRVTLRRLVREGRLPLRENPLDKRQKLIPEEAIEELAIERPPGQTLDRKYPRPESIGMVDDLGVSSDDVDAWLEANWHPC